MIQDTLAIARLEEGRQARGTAEMVQLGIREDPACADHRVEEIGGGIACYAGPGAWANQACGLGLDGPESDEDLDHLVVFYVSRGIEPRIEVCALADESLLEGLAQRGFVLKEFENVLVRELSQDEDLDGILPRPADPAYFIERVDPEDPAQVEVLARVANSGFVEEGEEVSEAMLRGTRQLVSLPSCAGFVARDAEQVVGAATTEAGSGVAALFGASVLPAHRRRGIQASLMLARMRLAQERDCRIVTIHSMPGIPTERNAARLGFRLAYAKALMVAPGEGLLPSP